MGTKENKKINEEQIAEAISRIETLCEYNVDNTELSIEKKKENLMFARRLLMMIPVEQKSENAKLVITSPIVTKRVIEDCEILLKSRQEDLQKK